MLKTRLFDATTTTFFTYLLQTRWCLQMLMLQQSVQVLRYLLISQMLLPRQSLQQLLTRWCSQMWLSSHCLHELLLMPLSPLSLHCLHELFLILPSPQIRCKLHLL